MMRTSESGHQSSRRSFYLRQTVPPGTSRRLSRMTPPTARNGRFRLPHLVRGPEHCPQSGAGERGPEANSFDSQRGRRVAGKRRVVEADHHIDWFGGDRADVRPPNSAAADGDNPHNADAAVNRASPSIQTRRMPQRSPSVPPASRRLAKLSVYALSTRWRPVTSVDRSEGIRSSATLTID